jgi:hypothetical protein
MAEAGCSEDFIASISGHTDYREIRKYVQAANKARMATEGMERTLAPALETEGGRHECQLRGPKLPTFR